MLERAGEEQPLFADRPAHLKADLVLLGGIALQTRKVLLKTVRIERIILQIKIPKLVELVPARARDGVGDISRRAAVLGGEVVGRNTILLDRLGSDPRGRSVDQAR